MDTGEEGGMNGEIGIAVHNIAQETLLNALWWPKWEENEKKIKYKKQKERDVHMQLIHVAIQQKLAQHCKELHSNKSKI